MGETQKEMDGVKKLQVLLIEIYLVSSHCAFVSARGQSNSRITHNIL